MTDKQLEIYEIIKNFISKNGYSPSIREICRLSNRSSPATISDYLVKLRDKGYINFIDGKNRTITLRKR